MKTDNVKENSLTKGSTIPLHQKHQRHQLPITATSSRTKTLYLPVAGIEDPLPIGIGNHQTCQCPDARPIQVNDKNCSKDSLGTIDGLRVLVWFEDLVGVDCPVLSMHHSSHDIQDVYLFHGVYNIGRVFVICLCMTQRTRIHRSRMKSRVSSQSAHPERSVTSQGPAEQKSQYRGLRLDSCVGEAKCV